MFLLENNIKIRDPSGIIPFLFFSENSLSFLGICLPFWSIIIVTEAYIQIQCDLRESCRVTHKKLTQQLAGAQLWPLRPWLDSGILTRMWSPRNTSMRAPLSHSNDQSRFGILDCDRTRKDLPFHFALRPLFLQAVCMGVAVKERSCRLHVRWKWNFQS